MTRLAVLPDPTKTFQVCGDPHLGALSQQRQDKIVRDMLSLSTPGVVARLWTGDSADGGTTGQDALAAAFYARLTDAPWRVVPGNHDLFGNRTRTTWAASLGVTATPWTWDLGFFQIIGLGTIDATTVNSSANNCYLPQSDIDYLDTALTAAGSTPCGMLSHAPLYNTVLGPTTGANPQFISTDPLFFEHGPAANSADDTAIRTILGNHANAKAWFSGHTHSDIFAPGLITTLSLGGHNVAAVNVSSPYYTGQAVDITDRITSMYVTVTSTGLELRCRDHGAGTWIGPGIGAARVTTVTY